MSIKSLVGNKFFTVSFIKKDGTLRKMNARLGVKKHLKGGVSKYDIDHLLTVFDMVKREYRTINLETITSLVFKGKNYTINKVNV